jgi:hypothetical protein
MYRTALAATTLAMACALTGVATAPATAAPGPDDQRPAASGYPCGYDSYHGGDQPVYNHCGKTDVVIRVHHLFWQTTYDCVTPGVHTLDQGTSQWRITSAEYDGHPCSFPGPVVGP